MLAKNMFAYFWMAKTILKKHFWSFWFRHPNFRGTICVGIWRTLTPFVLQGRPKYSGRLPNGHTTAASQNWRNLL
jgi:hypothetical protein